MVRIPVAFKHVVIATVVAAAFIPLAAIAQDHYERHEREHDRYRHEHPYPALGYSVTVLPSGYISVTYGAGRYFFHSGVWYQQIGPGYVVVRPPAGVIVPVLPPDYMMVSVAGAQYYYANDIYYAAGPGGYVVAQPPIAAGSSPPPASPPGPVQLPASSAQVAPAATATGAPPGSWYYCDSAKAYYPYVAECKEGWRSVPASLPH